MTFPNDGGRALNPGRPSLPDQRPESDTAPHPPVQDVIGERLRAVYSEILRDPIPQRFVDLLQRLDGRTEDRA
jgi:hypothetical protein